MQLPLYQIDAFTDQLFKGNPAAVVPLTEWLPDTLMQAIAAENNLAETAFFIPLDSAAADDFHLRWFTPDREMDLCGHATLASAYVLFERLQPERSLVRFKTLSGTLIVKCDEAVNRDSPRLSMDFPARPAAAKPLPAEIARALGVEPIWSGLSRDWLVVLENERRVRAAAPDFATLMKICDQHVIVTAPGDNVDFVSRFFAPRAGVFEDPVTGSAHCTLVPYWAEHLQKSELHARQVSARGGDIHCVLDNDRVYMSGACTHYMTAEITV